MNARSNRKAITFVMAALLAVASTAACAQGAVAPEYRWLTFTVFAAIIALTMYVTFLAAKRVKSASDFYTAGGGVTGLQNGLALGLVEPLEQGIRGHSTHSVEDRAGAGRLQRSRRAKAARAPTPSRTR